MQKIYQKIQDALNSKISFNNLYIFLQEIDILDLHSLINEIVLKSNKYLINNPPTFSKYLCLYISKPEIITIKSLINYFNDNEKLILLYFFLEKNNYSSLPYFFKKINLVTLQECIKNFPIYFFDLIKNEFTIKELSFIFNNYHCNILKYIIQNYDFPQFKIIINNLKNDSFFPEIMKSNFPKKHFLNIKKSLKTSNQYSSLYLLTSYKCLENSENNNFLIEVFFQQKKDTLNKICPFLSPNFIIQIIKYSIENNLDCDKISWLNLNKEQNTKIKIYLENISLRINKIISSYDSFTISKKYEFIRKNINLNTYISNNILKKNLFSINTENTEKLKQIKAIYELDKNTYI